jgi:UDP-N-acetylglucosamine:LPS N-acetylglucosamine transferase
MKRILVLTGDAGLGHRKAANAIKAALEETYRERCTVEVINPLEDPRVPAVLRESESDYDRIVKEMPNLYELGYQASDGSVPGVLIEGALTVLLYVVIRDLIRDWRPDAIVTTYPTFQAPVGAVKTVEGLDVPLITVVTDLVTVHRIWFSRAADLCVVPTQAARETAIRFGLPPHRVEVIGIPVDGEISKQRDRAALRRVLGWQEDLPTLLVVGGKRVSHLNGVLRALNHSGLPLQLAIVSGGNEEAYRTYKTVEWHVPAHVYGFVDNMPTLMRAADAVICKAGGLIVTESLASGLPLLLVDVLPGQEEGNAEYVVRGGAGERLADPVDVLVTLYHWLDRQGALLSELTQNAVRLGRPRAAYEIGERVWAMVEQRAESRAQEVAERSGLVELLTEFDVPRQRDGESSD